MSTQSEHSIPIVPVSSDIPTVENQNFQSEAHCSTIENINHAPTEAEVSLSRPESPENFEPELEEENNGALKKALQAIQDKNFETASDDMFSFHRKIARENGIAISGWSTISNYIYKKHSHYIHDFRVSVNDFRPVEDLKMISDRFPISALMRDRAKSKNSFQISGASTKGAKKGAIDNSEEENDRVQPT
ncbi:13950_t:CDS:2 [Entrophospora sp. SA101]|nr:13950_t:CDS:2 [Entrophospora sp. SA101]